MGALAGSFAGKLAGGLFSKIGGLFGFGGGERREQERQRREAERIRREEELAEAMERERQAREDLIQSLTDVGMKFLETGHATDQFKRMLLAVPLELSTAFAELYFEFKQAKKDLGLLGDLRSGIQSYLPANPVEQFLESGEISDALRDLADRRGLDVTDLEDFASARKALSDFEKTVADINKTMGKLDAATERMATGITSLARGAMQSGRITGDLDVALRGVTDDLAASFRGAIEELKGLRKQRGVLEELRSGIEQYLPPSPVEEFLKTGVITNDLLAELAGTGLTKEDLEAFSESRRRLERFNEARKIFETQEGFESEKSANFLAHLLHEAGMDPKDLSSRALDALESKITEGLQTAAVDLNRSLEDAIYKLTDAIDRLENKIGSLSIEVGSEFAELARLSALREKGALSETELEESGYTQDDLDRFDAVKGQLDPFGAAAQTFEDMLEHAGTFKQLLDDAGLSQENLNAQILATRDILEGELASSASLLDQNIGTVMGNLSSAVETMKGQLSSMVGEIASAFASIPSEIHTTHYIHTVRTGEGRGTGGSHDDGEGFRPPGLKRGGFADAGEPYVVGESKPEVFVPTRSGYVVANESLDAVQRRRGGREDGTGERGRLPDIVLQLDGEEVARVVAHKIPRIGSLEGW